MLRQSVMGSDMSYNDMMEDRTMEEIYKASISGSEKVNNRDYWIIEMEARIKGLPYPNEKPGLTKNIFYLSKKSCTLKVENY